MDAKSQFENVYSIDIKMMNINMNLAFSCLVYRESKPSSGFPAPREEFAVCRTFVAQPALRSSLSD